MDFLEGSFSSSLEQQSMVPAPKKIVVVVVASPACDAHPLWLRRRTWVAKLMPCQVLWRDRTKTTIATATRLPYSDDAAPLLVLLAHFQINRRIKDPKNFRRKILI